MYKNLNKEIARETIWKHTIKTLTTNANQSTIITDREVYLYWEHTKNYLKDKGILDLQTQEEVLNKFIEYRKLAIQDKKIEKIKILFFCGPEPENDIEMLLELEVLEENIWAVELDKSDYSSALNVIRHAYPNVKIFKTRIENIFDVIKIKFDIVYLDYTAPFFSKEQKPFKTTIELFKNNILNDFGVLITNYSEINPTDKYFSSYTATIKEYFNFQSFVHELTEEEGTFLTSPHIEEPEFLDLINKKYPQAYSSFLTHFHIYLAEIITPSLNIFKNQGIKSILFDERKLRKHLNKIKQISHENEDEYIKYGSKVFNPESFWFEYFFENISEIHPSLHSYLKLNKIDQFIQFLNLLKDLYTGEEFVNKDTLKYLKEAQANLIDPRGGVFCDVPMIHLWINLLINQLGAPYHINLKNHKRFQYIGNEREMFVDILTVDKCRYFYDWLPSLASLPETMLDVAKQLLIRMNIDIIRKNTQNYLIEESYRYGNLICYNDDGAEFLDQLYLERRAIIESKSESRNNFVEMFQIADFLAKRVADNYYKSFNSFIRFHMTYTAHVFVSLKITHIPEEFKVFGKKFKKYNIEEKYNFFYYSRGKELRYRTKQHLNGSHRFDLMIIKTIKSVFDRYGFICTIEERSD